MSLTQDMHPPEDRHNEQELLSFKPLVDRFCRAKNELTNQDMIGLMQVIMLNQMCQLLIEANKIQTAHLVLVNQMQENQGIIRPVGGIIK